MTIFIPLAIFWLFILWISSAPDSSPGDYHMEDGLARCNHCKATPITIDLPCPCQE